MIINEFVYVDLWQVYCQAYGLIRDWIGLGEFSITNFNIESEVVYRLNELMAFYRSVFMNADQFEPLINYAMTTPDSRDMLKKIDPSYESFTGDKGFFVYRFSKLLLQETLHSHFDEFKTLWRNRKRIHNEYVSEKVDLYSYRDLKSQIYDWICDWIIDEDSDEIVSYSDISLLDRLDDVIDKNRERYIDTEHLMPLMRLIYNMPSFKYPSSFMLPTIVKPEDVPDILRKIWIVLFREVLIENFAEFKGMRTLRRRINTRI